MFAKFSISQPSPFSVSCDTIKHGVNGLFSVKTAVGIQIFLVNLDLAWPLLLDVMTDLKQKALEKHLLNVVLTDRHVQAVNIESCEVI